MSGTQPLPDDVTVEELGESYLIVPYGVQFEGVQQPTPVSCIIYDKSNSTITGYTITNSGGWKNIGSKTLQEVPEILQSQQDSIYQSVLGCTGEDWEALHELDLMIQSLIDIDPNKLSELQQSAEDLQPPVDFIEMCSCDSKNIEESQVYKIQADSIKLRYCTNCGGIESVFGVSEGKKKGTINQQSQLDTLSFVEDSISPDKITETDHNDLYIVTDKSQEYSSFDLLATGHWWHSQRANPNSRPFTSLEMNVTVLNNDDSVVGVVLWSYLFGTYPIIHHLNINSNTPPIYIKELFNTFATDVVESSETSDIFLTYPYAGPRAIGSLFTPLKIASGYVKIEKSVEEIIS